MTVLLPIWVYVNVLFFKINFFFKALLDANVSCHNCARIWFQKQYHNYILILNLYLTSEQSQSKKKR